ncbi:predicted protein [Naegleria gruberi]|uniref:Predicted protein n=1 Tax=Naegleria gruberi TaxID=5762 RepID=D2VYS0_NAEGR|nr:uncharacterized protein NAEGRDRAFT_59612 [Naegleria gruberi]EFC38003.1 predicted protein [Naegleria gruberi]|eukprot:XP_002670747.1 predicted protein [Naegleria gruberi strain NEG-M]
MLPLILILFLAGFPILTKYLVAIFSPSTTSSSASSGAAKKVDENSSANNKKETPKNTTTTTATAVSSSTKDAPLKVDDQKTKPVIEKVEKPSVVVAAETKPTEVVIEKVTPIVAEKKEEPVATTLVETPVEIEKEEEISTNEFVEETTPVVVSNTVQESNEFVPEEPVAAVDETPVEVQKEEETKPVVAVVTESSEQEREFVSNLDVEKSSFVIKPSHISKYLIGQKGATINKIKDETQSKIDMSPIDDDSTLVTITANGEGFDLEKTYIKLRDELKVYGWEFDKNENQFVEHLTESMKLFKELEKKIQEQAQIMASSFENAKKAFEEGDKGLASQLSNEGKHAQSLMKQYQEESANVMYDHLNKDRPETEIDLHGQYVDAAMNFLKQRIEKLKSQSINQLTIIYGAGNHSDASGPKIKPAVLTYLKENNLTYEEQTQGSILANI